jgi:hypothetical protein
MSERKHTPITLLTAVVCGKAFVDVDAAEVVNAALLDVDVDLDVPLAVDVLAFCTGDNVDVDGRVDNVLAFGDW